jgi:hypothetical protein
MRLNFQLHLAAVIFVLSFPAHAAPIVGLTTNNRIVRFDSATPGATTTPLAITGLTAGQSLVGIDFRPIDGALVGVSSDSSGNAQAYTIDQNTGIASTLGGAFSVLPGNTFGIDFNPVPNALRIVTDGEANLRITNGGAGTVNTDGTLKRPPTDPDPTLAVAAAAYSNNVPGGVNGTTTLYVIDAFTGQLYTQGSVNFSPSAGTGTSPNTGNLFLVGSLNLGAPLINQIGFDISDTGQAYLSTTAATVASRFYTLNVADASNNFVGLIGDGSFTVRDIAAAPTAVPEPSTVLLSGLSLTALAVVARRRRT